MHAVANRILTHAIVPIRHLAATGFLFAMFTVAMFTVALLTGALVSAGAKAGNLDGVQFVDDLEQSLQRRSATAQRPANARPNVTRRTTVAGSSPAPRYLPDLSAQPQRATRAATEPTKKKSWRPKFSFKNPLGKLWGGPSKDSSEAPSFRQTAATKPQLGPSTGYLNPVYQKGKTPSAPAFNAQGPVAQVAATSRAANGGGIATRSNARNSRSRSLFSLVQKKPATAAPKLTSKSQPVTLARDLVEPPTLQPAQQASSAPRWTDRLSLPLAMKKPSKPLFKSEPGLAMISDLEETPTPQPKPRAASNFSNGRFATNETKADAQKLPVVVGPPRTIPAIPAVLNSVATDNGAQLATTTRTPHRDNNLRTLSVPREIVNRHVASEKRNVATQIASSQMPVGQRTNPVRPATATESRVRPVAPLGVKVAKSARLMNLPTNPVAGMPAAPVPPSPHLVEPPKPTKKGVELLARANRMSQTAASEEEYTTIIQTCRQVLAIDTSPTAVKYSKQLASWALNRRGELKADQGRTTEALLDYEDSLRLDLKRWRAIHNRGVMAAQAGRFADAFDDFNQTLKINPKFAKAYSNRATLYVEAGQLAKARSDYRRAIANDPDLAVAHKGCGRVCHMLGELDAALQHFDAAALLAPGDAKIVDLRGDLLSDMGHYRSAATNYRRAIELDDQFATAYRNLSWLQSTCPDQACRDNKLALANAERAMALNAKPNDLDYDTLGAAQAAGGEYEAAKASMDRALELAGESDKANYQWRRSLYERGQPYIAEPAGIIQQASYAN